jgi:hypothetical protein
MTAVQQGVFFVVATIGMSIFIGVLWLLQRRWGLEPEAPALTGLPSKRRQNLRQQHLARLRDIRRKRANRLQRTTEPVREPGNVVPPNHHLTRDITKTPDLTAEQRTVIRSLLEHDISGNQIFTLLGGTRTIRLKQIAEIRAEIQAERLARELANPAIEVPALEPIPQ